MPVDVPHHVEPTKVFGGHFGRAVVTLGSGAALGQLVTILASPVLTRIYAPDQIGALAAFVSILSMLSVIAALRYELAIPLPVDSESAFSVLAVAMLVVVGFAVLVAGAVFALDARIMASLGMAVGDGVRWLIPAGVLAAGLLHALSQWAVRVQAFAVIARVRLLQAACSAGIQVLGGLVTQSTVWLLVGHAAGLATGAAMFARHAMATAHAVRPLSRGLLAQTLWRYRRFPLIAAPSGLLNTFSLAAPVLILANRYGPEAAAMYAIAHRATGAPLGLLTQSVGQVFYSEGSRIAQSHPGRLMALFLRVTLALAVFGVLPVAVVVIAGPSLWAAVFGAEWHQAGVLARIMGPMFLGQIIASPVSGVLYVLERQGAAAVLDATRAGGIVVALLVPSMLGLPLETAITTYSLTMAAAYGAWWATSYGALQTWWRRGGSR